MSRLADYLPFPDIVWCYICGKPVDKTITSSIFVDAEVRLRLACYDHFEPKGPDDWLQEQ